MNEALLHTIWKYKLLQKKSFVGTNNESIEIISIGEHNQDSGPDFFNSKIRINDLLLVGNVEIHVKTSDWIKHQHHIDKSYDNLILHIVYEHDTLLEQNVKNNVTVLELKQHIKPTLIEQYNQLLNSKQKIACGKAIATVPSPIWNMWLDRLAVSRLENKTAYIEHLFLYAKNNFEETLYILLCRNFGFKINADAFELLAKHLPYHIVKKHSGNLLQIEALLFGVAGLLDEAWTDAYVKQLQNEYEFLRIKYNLIPLKKIIWKFSKTRPANFPTMRIAQLAQYLNQQKSLFHLIEEKPTIEDFKSFFEIQPSEYWQTHYLFDVLNKKVAYKFGVASIHNVLINTIIPYLFFIAKHSNKDYLIDYALSLLQQIPAEENTKTKLFSTLGKHSENALETQAKIQLYDKFCVKKECLKCNVAEFLLKNNS